MILAFYLISWVYFTDLVVYAANNLNDLNCKVLRLICSKRKHDIIIALSKRILLTKGFDKIKSRLIDCSRLISCGRLIVYGTVTWDNISCIGWWFPFDNNTDSDFWCIVAINPNIEVIRDFLFLKGKSIHKADNNILLLKGITKFHILPVLISGSKYSRIATNNSQEESNLLNVIKDR